MKRSTKSNHPIDVANASLAPELARSRYGKWRALSLILLHVLIVIHILHWKAAGKTMAPLELSEIMKALELRVLSAGVIFIGVMIIGSAIFGRFFCSWGCHMLAAQDLCHWILKKLRIRPRPIRSRVLLVVPLVAAGYMFVWPQFKRMLAGYELPKASTRFVTTDFWRDLPGPLVILLTFLVCGLLIVYFFGGRGFCRYGCPYGVLFGLFDRVAPGKIRSAGGCQQCGRCTAICTSGVRVHEQVKAYGMVVDSRCLKDLDCVSVCPSNALEYRFGRPSLFRSRAQRPPRVKYDFSIPEEIAMVVVFIAAILTWRGLYDRLPFLMSLALSAVTAYLTVSFARLFYRRTLTVNRYVLKSDGKLLRAGYVFAVLCGVFLLFTAHSAFVQYHRRTADYLLEKVASASEDGDDRAGRNALLEEAIAHLEICDRLGIVSTTLLEMKLGISHLSLGRSGEAEHYLQRAVERSPNHPEARIQLATALTRNGKPSDAAHHLSHALELHSPHAEHQPRLRYLYAEAHRQLAGLFLKRERLDAAERHYREALRFQPNSADVHFKLGLIAGEEGRFDDALLHYRESLRLKGSAKTYSNLGDILVARNDPEGALSCYESALAAEPDIEKVHFKMGVVNYHLSRLDVAERHLRAAIRQSPDDADAHFNLGRLCARKGDRTTASFHLRRAAELDASYAELLKS